MATKSDYRGTPIEFHQTLQRLALRKKREDDPQTANRLAQIKYNGLNTRQKKRLPDFLDEDMITCVCENSHGVLWLGTHEGLYRINETDSEPLDRVWHFRASAYMLDNDVEAVEDDGDNGVWVLTETSVSHIALKYMSAKEKAIYFSELNYKYVQRRGMLSGARWDSKNERWHARESDNDGLWTSLVAMGDLCRYAVLRDDPNSSPEEVARAREVATRWTEAVLLLAYIPAWRGTVPALVRYNVPGTNRASQQYLKQGKSGKLRIPDNGPTDFVSAYLGPENPDEWALCDEIPEIVFKNVEGFIARSYHVDDEENDKTPIRDGVFFRKKYTPDGKLISVKLPSSSDKGDDLPTLLSIDSSMEIPDRLRRLYTEQINPKTGKGFCDDDIIYKCDTSNDELVGHYAVWHLAYDILGPEDPELAEMISVIAARHAKHLADNDYALVDAGGQPTSWSRMTREYYMNKNSDGYADAPLGTMILLQLFKVAHHVTGDEHWNEEYRKLALSKPYRYADLACEHYERYEQNIRDAAKNQNLTSEEMFPTIVKCMNYSDVRMAAVAYYTITQLEKDEELLAKYRKGAQCWWRLEKYARDIEWSLIYQLVNPGGERLDAFGRPCLEMLRWQLMHFPICARDFHTDNTTRPDLREEDGMMWYRDTETPTPYAVALDERGSMGTDFFDSVTGRDGKVIGKTYNMIMAYWIARYNGAAVEKGKDSGISFDELFAITNQD